MDSLCALVQTALTENPFAGQLFIFRGRRGDRLKVLWHEPDGLCLYCKRLDRGHFVWPQATSGAVLLMQDFAQWTRPISSDWTHLAWVTGGAAGDDFYASFFREASFLALTPR